MGDRRAFLRHSGLGLGLGLTSLAWPALGAQAGGLRDSRPMIIDALGAIENLNIPEALRSAPLNLGIDARALADAKAAGLTAFNMTIGYVSGSEDPYQKSLSDIRDWDAFIAAHSQSLLKVRSASDIAKARADGRIGVILGFQNAAMMGDDASRVATFAKAGVRVIQLTYNGPNQLGDGSMGPANRGLTPFGREVVHELNRNRVLVDLSHSGERICLDAIAASAGPIAITHTGCRALADLPRNKTDKELRLVADKGGFVGIYFMPFLAIGRQPMAADLIAHIEHAIKVCGEDQVGIGTDGSITAIDDMPTYMKGLDAEVKERRASGIGATGERSDIVPFLPDLSGPEKFWKLADLLAKRGHGSGRIEKILGTNFLRVAGGVWS